MVQSGKTGEVLTAHSVTMDKAQGWNPESFIRVKPVVKPFPVEAWINWPESPANQPETSHELVPKEPSLEAGESFGTGSCHSNKWTNADRYLVDSLESISLLCLNLVSFLWTLLPRAFTVKQESSFQHLRMLQDYTQAYLQNSHTILHKYRFSVSAYCANTG